MDILPNIGVVSLPNFPQCPETLVYFSEALGVIPSAQAPIHNHTADHPLAPRKLVDLAVE